MGILKEHCTEEAGECVGIQLVYSGSFALTAEWCKNGPLTLQGGINDLGFGWELAGGENFRFAERLFAGEELEKLCREAEKIKDKNALFAALSLTARDLLLYRTGQKRFASLKGAKVKTLAADYHEGALLAAARYIREAERDARFNASLRQCLYTLGLKILEEKAKWQKLS